MKSKKKLYTNGPILFCTSGFLRMSLCIYERHKPGNKCNNSNRSITVIKHLTNIVYTDLILCTDVQDSRTERVKELVYFSKIFRL